MKEAGRSVHPGDVVKKKSSSGCLIIKKKVVDGAGVAKGFSDSPSRNLFNTTKEKKRPRPIRSDSESSDEFTEPHRRRIENFHGRSGFIDRGFLEKRRVDNEFDEYSGFHEREIRKDAIAYDHHHHNHGLKLHYRSGDHMESGSGSSRRIEDGRREFIHNSSLSARPNHGRIRSRYEMEEDESHLPLQNYHAVSDKPIRLQGKNGVLKVMVNKHKQINVSRQTYNPTEADNWNESRPVGFKKKPLHVSHKSHDHWEAFDRELPNSEGAYKKKAATGPSSDSHLAYKNKKTGDLELAKPVPFAFKNKNKGDLESAKSMAFAFKDKKKGDLELAKPMFATSNKETDDSDTSLPLQKQAIVQRSTEKVITSERNISPPTKNAAIVKGKESKVKRGSGTEKQLLREKIRSMLLSSGWTIDYRPRRNRDYLDAVYINPSGTAYWSIIKAYEALQKEEKDHSQVGVEFTPLPVETLSKLTRQTRKKMEREMKKKRKDEGTSRNPKRERVEVSGEDVETSKRRLEEESGDDSNDNYYMETPNQDNNNRAAKRIVQERKSRKLGRCTLLVRNEGNVSENEKFVPYSGKRTLLSWLIDSGTVEMSEKVEYMNRRRTRVMQEGWITKDGIRCGCCSKILSVLKFELHAGSKLRQPFKNIFIQSGKTLMQCQIDAWNKQGELERKGFHVVDVDGDDPNDDTCGLCGDGGDLICCDGCPSTFHQSCLGLQMLPQGDWHCPNCSCKYCELASKKLTEGSAGSESELLECCVCEKKYHESCRLDMNEKVVDQIDTLTYFCGHKCVEVYSQLQKVLGVKHELDLGFSWSLINRSDLSMDTPSTEFSKRVECNSKLAVAMSVIDECFVRIADRRSGINIIHNVLYNCGSNFSRLNYSGFYTAILERGDEVISAASIRIHGTRLAEMPFIGTRLIYRRQGMCRRLLSAIESALAFLHVEKLIIPAVDEHKHTWTDVFGFEPLKESHRQEMRSMNMLVFPGTDMLQKPIVNQTPLIINTVTEKDTEKPEGSSPADSGSPSDSKVEEVVAETEKESVAVIADSDSKVDVHKGKIGDVVNDSIAADAPCEAEPKPKPQLLDLESVPSNVAEMDSDDVEPAEGGSNMKKDE